MKQPNSRITISAQQTSDTFTTRVNTHAATMIMINNCMILRLQKSVTNIAFTFTTLHKFLILLLRHLVHALHQCPFVYLSMNWAQKQLSRGLSTVTAQTKAFAAFA